MFLPYLKLILAMAVFLFLPGFSFLHLLSRRGVRLSAVEKLTLSVAISISLVNFSVLLIDRLGLALSLENLGKLGVLLIAVPLVLVTLPPLKFSLGGKVKKKIPTAQEKAGALPAYLKIKKKTWFLAASLIFLAFLINTRFLAGDIVPNNTDLGHHMYWSQLMVAEEKIPTYDTSDVIVGEHIIFALLSKVSEVSVISAMPVIGLFLIGLLGALAVYALALRIFKKPTIAWGSFSLVAILYAVASPMGKFISGGVIGNVMGNLFVPLVLLTTYLAVAKKNRAMAFLSLFLFWGILYIHHLSTFLLIFILIFSAVLYLALNWQQAGQKLKRLWQAYGHPLPLLALVSCLVFLGLVYTPHYLSSGAVETVVQEPTKDTHQGVSLMSFVSSVGEAKTLLGFLGLILLVVLLIKRKRASWGKSLLLGWTLILILLSFYPGIFMVDLPSRRVVNYLVFPLAILAAYFLMSAFDFSAKKLKGTLVLPLSVIAVLTALVFNGMADSFQYFRKDNQFLETVAIYHASAYLKEETTQEDVILKDHANLVADNWIKVFLLRGYDYLLSRTFDYKYEDPTSGRDDCPFEMAIAPDSEKGLTCFQETGTSFVVLRKGTDNFFFDLSDNFSKIYDNGTVVIHKRVN